jgi:tetratricopeptide (TPR) repeat protein
VRKSKLLPLVLIFSVLSYTPVGLGQSVEELLNQAADAYGQQNYTQAESIYRQIIKNNPHHAEAYLWLGSALSNQGKLEEAIVNLRQAIQLDPKSATAYFSLAIVLSNQGKLEEAITNYQKTIQLDPKFAGAYFNLAFVLSNQGKLEEAITNYQKTIQLDPKFAGAYFNLAIVLSNQGKLEEAITNYQKTIQLDPKFAGAYTNLGVVLYLQGKLEEAITNYRIALSLPDKKGSPASYHTLAHNSLGYALQKQGKLPEAIAEYQKSIALDRNFVYAQNNLKEAQRLLGQRSPQYVPPPASDLASVPTLQQEPLRDELRATVLIIANDIPGTQGPTRGTGWVVKREGNTIWVMTNRHVIANQQRQPSPKIEIEFFSDIEATRRTRFPATVEQISNDENLDLAVLKITGIPDDIRPLKMGTGRVSRNTKIIVIGHPINADPWNSSGGEVTNYSINKVTISAVVATGNSGGPVINETTKEVIGIMVRVADEDIATDPNTPTPAVPDEVFTTGGFGIAYPIDLVQQQLTKWGINP